MNLTEVEKMTEPINCKALDFTLFPISKSTAITSDRLEEFFLPEKTKNVMKEVKDSFFVHLSDHISKDFKFQREGTTAYKKLAEKFCPKVLKASGNKL
jgi:Alpha 1,4-glycosyltransferase conserved region